MNNRRFGWLIAMLAGLALVPLLAPSRRAESPRAQATTWEELAASTVLAIKAGALDEAFRLQKEALASVSPARSGDIRPARTYVLLGEIQQTADKPELAEEAFQRAITVCEESVGVNDPAVVEFLDSLANFYYYREQFDRVAPLYQRALDISVDQLRRAHREMANRARNLALVHQTVGNQSQAEHLFQQSLAAGAKSGELFRSDLIHDMMTAAEFYRTCEEFDQARSVAQKALEMAEREMGPDSMDAALGLDCLGQTYLATGNPDKAEPLFTRALAIAEQTAGSESSDLAPRLTALADAFRRQRKFEQADLQFQRALEVTESNLGPQCLEMADLLEKYAALLQDMDRHAEAEARLDQAASIRNWRSDPSVPDCPSCQLK